VLDQLLIHFQEGAFDATSKKSQVMLLKETREEEELTKHTTPNRYTNNREFTLQYKYHFW